MAEQVKTKSRPLSTNESEIAFLKSTFAENEYLLKAIRSLFLGFPITDGDAKLIVTTFANKDLKLALRKKMYPEVSPLDEIGETADFWFGTETEIIGKDADTIKQIVASKQLVLEHFETAFKLFDNPAGPKVDLSFDVTGKTDKLQVKLLARNKYIRSVETALTIIKVIAGKKEESAEEAKRRLERDSAK